MLREVKKLRPRAEIRFWCDNKFAGAAKDIMGNFDANIPVHTILAGKLRRYHHLSVIRQLLWPSLVLSNIKDGFLVIAGFFQSFFKLIVWRPDVVFTKGGYVCLPVGIAARILRIPLVVHDSDAHPGLTNLILSKWATAIATGAPLEYYPYPKSKSHYVGIPIAPEFHEFTDIEKNDARQKWGISSAYPLVVVTGGGLGAGRINDAIATTLNDLLKFCSVVLISGSGQYDELRSLTPENNDRFQLHSFISKDMALLMGSADLVVARAGATTILELAALRKPTILVPNAKLTGGHQLKNAAVYLNEGAVRVVNDEAIVESPQILVDEIRYVLDNYDQSCEMGQVFGSFSRPDAARDVADMIISSAK